LYLLVIFFRKNQGKKPYLRVEERLLLLGGGILNSIRGFSREYRWLSNFYVAGCLVLRDDEEEILYPSVEHAYQAAKTLDHEERKHIALVGRPGNVKSAGRSVELRPGWEEIKLEVMLGLLRQKFRIPHLKKKLLATGDTELIESNTWGDKFWGVDKWTGEGKNYLGKLLMQIRNELREEV
jgi:N-glycosidase YbiA